MVSNSERQIFTGSVAGWLVGFCLAIEYVTSSCQYLANHMDFLHDDCLVIKGGKCTS